MVVGCHYCDTSRNSDFGDYGSLLLVIFVFVSDAIVDFSDHGGVYFDDIICERTRAAVIAYLVCIAFEYD